MVHQDAPSDTTPAQPTTRVAAVPGPAPVSEISDWLARLSRWTRPWFAGLPTDYGSGPRARVRVASRSRRRRNPRTSAYRAPVRLTLRFPRCVSEDRSGRCLSCSPRIAPLAFQRRQKGFQRLGIDDVGLGGPATARRGDAEVEVLEVIDAVRVSIDRELDAGCDGLADMLVLEVQAFRVAVDLQHRTGTLRCGDDGVDVDVVGFAPLQHAAGGMEQDVGVGILHRPDDAFGHVRAREV